VTVAVHDRQLALAAAILALQDYLLQLQPHRGASGAQPHLQPAAQAVRCLKAIAAQAADGKPAAQQADSWEKR
jgi:hypothetical protein